MPGDWQEEERRGLSCNYRIQVIRELYAGEHLFGTMTGITYAIAGLVNWLIVVKYLAGCIPGGIIGARLVLRLGTRKKMLSRVFAGIMLVVAAYVLHVNVTALHLLR